MLQCVHSLGKSVLKIPTWGSVALAVNGNAKANMKTGVGVTTGLIAVARVRSMRRTPP